MAQKKGGKAKIKVKKSAQLRKKGAVQNDTIKKAKFQPLRDTGASFRVKIKRKGS